jgi:uncharacterized membrane protein YbhN (UPF0104 family)
MAESSNRTTSRSSVYLNAVKVILAFLLAGFIVSQTDFGQVRAVVEGVSLPWLVVYFVLFILSTLAKALQYRIVIGEGVAYPRVLNVVVVQNITSSFLAATVGIASYAALFRLEHGVKVSRAMIVFLLTKVGDVIAICLLLVLSMGWVWPGIGVFQWVSVLLAAGMILFLVIFCLLIAFRETFYSALQRVLQGAHLMNLSIVEKGMEALEAVSRQDRSAILRTMRWVIAGSFLYMGLSLAWLYAGLRVFGIRLGTWEVAYSSALYHLITYVPIQIFGGLGVTDTTMMYVYSLFGPAPARMAAVMIGLRILVYLMNLSLLVYLPLYAALYKPSDSGD